MRTLFKSEKTFYPVDINIRQFLKVPSNLNKSNLDLGELSDLIMDGRPMAPFVEYYAQGIDWKICGKEVEFIRLPKVQGGDGKFRFGNPNKKVGVRCLTQRGIYFERSRSRGSGRVKATQADLLNDLSAVNYYIICDITNSKTWYYWLVDVNLLIEQVKKSKLTNMGWTKSEFHYFLRMNGYELN